LKIEKRVPLLVVSISSVIDSANSLSSASSLSLPLFHSFFLRLEIKVEEDGRKKFVQLVTMSMFVSLQRSTHGVVKAEGLRIHIEDLRSRSVLREYIISMNLSLALYSGIFFLFHRERKPNLTPYYSLLRNRIKPRNGESRLHSKELRARAE